MQSSWALWLVRRAPSPPAWEPWPAEVAEGQQRAAELRAERDLLSEEHADVATRGEARGDGWVHEPRGSEARVLLWVGINFGCHCSRRHEDLRLPRTYEPESY